MIPAVETRDLVKHSTMEEPFVRALDGVTMTLEAGEGVQLFTADRHFWCSGRPALSRSGSASATGEPQHHGVQLQPPKR